MDKFNPSYKLLQALLTGAPGALADVPQLVHQDERGTLLKVTQAQARMLEKKGYVVAKTPAIAPLKIFQTGIFWHQEFNDIDGIGETVDQCRRVVELCIENAYLKLVPIFDVKDSFMEEAIEPSNCDTVGPINSLKKLLSSNRCKRNYTFRVESPKYVMSIKLTFTELAGKEPAEITSILYDRQRSLVRASLYCISLTESTIGDMSLGSFFICKRTKTIKEVLSDIMGISPANGRYGFHVDPWVLIPTMKAIQQFADKLMDDKYKGSCQHSYIEMYAFRQLLKFYNTDRGYTIGSPIVGWQIANMDNKKYNELSRERPPAIVVNPDVDIPILDLSAKEMQFIDGYVRKRNWLINRGDPIDLMKMLGSPRYGSDFHWNISTDEESIRLTTSYTLYPEDNFIRVILVHRVSPYATVHTLVDFTNIFSFTGPDDLMSMNTNIVQYDSNRLIDDFSDALDMVHPIMKDKQTILNAALMLLSVHILIHERPKRTRMLQYKEPRPKTTITKRVPQEEPEFVIRRILKPADEAKQLVAESVSRGSAGERIYTMEEWERVGHYRTTPSGRQVWIPETTCKRKKNLLSEKEIHIKL